MRRKLIVIPALAALLLTGAIAGTAFAQSESPDAPKVSRFVEILASKLGIGQEELQTAVEETKEELEAERKAEREIAPGGERGKFGFGRGHHRGKKGGFGGFGGKSWDKDGGEESGKDSGESSSGETTAA